jgi:hypothetical protein
MRCDHCETRLSGEPFRYGSATLCCECISALNDDPEMFRHLGIAPSLAEEAS